MCSHLKSALFSVVEEHEDGHLEGGDLQDVLSSIWTCNLGSTYTHLRTILLQKKGDKNRNKNKTQKQNKKIKLMF